MNEVVDIITWTVSVVINPEDMAVSARAESKHKFGESSEAARVTGEVIAKINEVVTADVLDKMAAEGIACRK